MTTLRFFPDDADPRRVTIQRDYEAIRTVLAGIDVRLEAWPVQHTAVPELREGIVEVLHAEVIDRVLRERRFVTHDVITVSDDHPAKDELRELFLEEHTHKEDEARFFLAGSGLFTFHHAGAVFALTAEKGDFVNVPAGMRHWFDMGPHPSFTALRFFNNPEGWIPYFTGNPIAHRFPRYDRPL